MHVEYAMTVSLPEQVSARPCLLVCAVALVQLTVAGCAFEIASAGYDVRGQLVEEGSGKALSGIKVLVSLDAKSDNMRTALQPPRNLVTNEKGVFAVFVPTDSSERTLPFFLGPLVMLDLLPPPPDLSPPTLPNFARVTAVIADVERSVLILLKDDMVSGEGVRQQLDLGTIAIPGE